MTKRGEYKLLTKTTIIAEEMLMKRVAEHTESRGETLTEFYTRAIINQLEKDGDYEIRDKYEELKENAEN